MIVDRTAQDVIVTVRLLDDVGAPITGIAFDNVGLEVKYKKPGSATWTTITPVSGTLGTYTSQGWVEDSENDGLYELGIPNDASVPGKRTVFKFKQGANEYRYDSVDYVAIASTSSDQPTFLFNLPGSEELFVSDSGTVYIKEQDRVIEFEANQDITAVTLRVVLETADQTDVHVFEDVDITKVGSTASVTLPTSFTNDTQSVNWAIRRVPDLRVLGQGTLSVSYAPFKDP